MGLAVSVGVLADLLENNPEEPKWIAKGFAAANQLLAEAGLPPHAEPRALSLPRTRSSLKSFPYSYIHYLRRAYAHRTTMQTWIAAPVSDDVKPANDPVLESVLEQLTSHLLCHSDAEGFYLPVDFRDVLFASSDNSDLPGGMLGSSFRLLEELVRVAPALGINLSEGNLSDEEAARIDVLAGSGGGLWRELASWLLLYESARLSIEHKTAVVFC